MIVKLASAFSRYMVKEGAVEADDMELAAFGLELLIADGLQIIILLALSLPFGTAPYMFLYCLFYTLLRRQIGGAHASTHFRCLCSFTVAAVISVYGGLIIPIKYALPLLICLSIFTVTAVFLRAPLGHPDSPRSEKSLSRFKKRSRVTAGVEGAILVICALLSPPCLLPHFLCAGLGCSTAAFTLLLPVRVVDIETKKEGG